MLSAETFLIANGRCVRPRASRNDNYSSYTHELPPGTFLQHLTGGRGRGRKVETESGVYEWLRSSLVSFLLGSISEVA